VTKAELRFAAVIIAGALALGACSLVGAPDDTTIKSSIEAKLFQDPILKTRDIHVEAQKGVVVLSGSVGSDTERQSVEQTANQAPGVKQVIDQLTVATAPAASAEPAASIEAAAPMKSATPLQVPEEKPAAPVAHRARARHAARQQAYSEPPPAPTSPPPASQPAPAPAPASAAPPAVAQAPQPAPAPAPPPPVQATVPAGTVVSVRMIDSIDSARNRPGEEFDATLSSAVVADGRVVMPQGSGARVRLVEAKTSGRMTGSSELQLELVSITANGTNYDVTSGYYTLQGASRGKRTAETVGGGSVVGALIGAIAGGGKGAAIGAGVGAATGGGVQAAGKGQQVKVPSEAKIDFTLKAPINATLPPGA